MTSKLKCPIKAYEATLTIDGKLVASATAHNIFTVIDDVMNSQQIWAAKEIKIEVKEI